MTNYSKKLKDPRWQKKRLQIMQRDKFKCRLCGDDETTLNVHHLVYHSGHEPWEYENHELITYCEHCHKEVEISKSLGQEIDFVYKSNNWRGDMRIMFCAQSDILNMSIYDGNDRKVIGFNFRETDMRGIRKTITKLLKNGKP